ncbi:MAG: hypothetical protein OEY45_07700 [Gammaproteobacteria bacterium]|nr:hypothetical protein [Gammaproteobacteria bacterium]
MKECWRCPDRTAGGLFSSVIGGGNPQPVVYGDEGCHTGRSRHPALNLHVRRTGNDADRQSLPVDPIVNMAERVVSRTCAGKAAG